MREYLALIYYGHTKAHFNLELLSVVISPTYSGSDPSTLSAAALAENPSNSLSPSDSPPRNFQVFDPAKGMQGVARGHLLEIGIPVYFRRTAIWSPTRRALATMVSVGFTAPMEGKKLASVM